MSPEELSTDAPSAEAGTSITASEVQVGDRLRSRDGTELTVTRIDVDFLGTPGFLAFVEDSAQQWFKMPSPPDAEVTLLSRG